MPKVVEEKKNLKKENKVTTATSKKPNLNKTSKNGKAVVNKKTDNSKLSVSSVKTSKDKKTKSNLSKIRAEKKEAKKDNRIIKESDLRKEKEEKEQELKKEKNSKKEYLMEYYDLPYRYDETVVTILAQTPKRLFVYWDVSDKDKEKYRKAFGEDFFEKTYPVLLIHNDELNYTFEVPINDFANSWYLDIKDSKTKYVVQLGRKFRNVQEAKKASAEIVHEEQINLQNDFIFITDSNKLESPNDHILFEKLTNQVTYRNAKNGNEFNKDISSLISKIQESYPKANLKDLYKELYGNEFEIDNGFNIANPSSGEMPTSGFRK
ncbi:MAG: DUF4912 domain-containing protein [Clostridia bacterium]|nr:DUF4912 domain-containing protein [Clostridia bacterium]